MGHKEGGLSATVPLTNKLQPSRWAGNLHAILRLCLVSEKRQLVVSIRDVV